MINTNLHPVSHRFEVIADYWSNLHFRQRGTHIWHTRSGWTPKLRTTKFSLKKLETLLYRMLFIDNYLVLSQYSRYWRISSENRRFWSWVSHFDPKYHAEGEIRPLVSIMKLLTDEQTHKQTDRQTNAWHDITTSADVNITTFFLFETCCCFMTVFHSV